jgi:hypothetical protein
MPAGPELVVAAPPLSPPLTGLLQAARVIELQGPAEHWLAGVRFSPEGQVQPDLFDICAGLATGNTLLAGGVGATAGAGGFRRSPRKFSPFAVEVPDVCSTFGFSMDEYADRARRSLLAREPWAVEREFEQGNLISTNPHLADNTDPYLSTVGLAPTSPRDSLALLDEAIANAGIGLGMIHCTPYIADQWANLRLIDFGRAIGDNGLPQPLDGIVGPQRYITSPKGNIIVIGNGYQGIGPDGTGGAPYDATFYDGVMTSGSAVLTSNTAAFVAGDVGKSIVVVGAGASGAALSTTILSRASATSVTLNASASTTVASAPFVIRSRTGDSTHAAQWAYATDLVQILRSADVTIMPTTLAQATDRAANNVTFRAQREYAVIWSGLLHAAVKVNTTPA